jgi:hypothetical protein
VRGGAHARDALLGVRIPMTTTYDPNEWESAGEECDLDDACDEMIDAITTWRKRGCVVGGVAKLFKAAETLQQEIMVLQEVAIVSYRRQHPLPPNRSDGVRCPCCGQSELPLYVVDTKCLPSKGWLSSYATFNPAGRTYMTNIHCPGCDRTYPLAAADAVELDTEDQDS